MRTVKKVSIVCLMAFVATSVYADRGSGKKARVKANLNIASASSLKKSIALNINSGLSYRGSLLYRPNVPNTGIMHNLVTYQKGNTTYILPYRNRLSLSDMRTTGGLKFSLRK